MKEDYIEYWPNCFLPRELFFIDSSRSKSTNPTASFSVVDAASGCDPFKSASPPSQVIKKKILVFDIACAIDYFELFDTCCYLRDEGFRIFVRVNEKIEGKKFLEFDAETFAIMAPKLASIIDSFDEELDYDYFQKHGISRDEIHIVTEIYKKIAGYNPNKHPHKKTSDINLDSLVTLDDLARHIYTEQLILS
jgi:hypothetical protein